MHIPALASTLKATAIMGTTILILVLTAEVTVVTIMRPVRMAKDGGTGDLGDLGDLVDLPAEEDGALIEVVGVVGGTVVVLIPSSSTQRWILSPQMMHTPSPSNSPVLRRTM